MVLHKKICYQGNGATQVTLYYSLNKRSAISFLENSKRESIISFVTTLKKNHPAQVTVIILNNLKSRKEEHMWVEAKGLGIGLFSSTLICELSSIEYMWKNMKRVMSTTFGWDMNDIKNTAKKTLYQPTKTLVTTRLDKFLAHYLD